MDEKVKETEAQDEVQAEQPETEGKEQTSNGDGTQNDTLEPDVMKEEDATGNASETENSTDVAEEEGRNETASEETQEKEEPVQEATKEAKEERKQTTAKKEIPTEETAEQAKPEVKEVPAEKTTIEKQPEPEAKEEKLPEEKKNTIEEAQPEEEPKTEDLVKAEIPDFKSGDTIIVHYKIREGGKERIQQFQGVVLQRKGVAPTETFTVRKISSGIGVERIFPLASPFLDKIEVKKKGSVRRARIFYLRQRTGKSARIKEKRG